MTDAAQLERRYRRLLACYPKAFRREHQEEMLVVLLACAGDGRRSPGLADSANLLCNALWLRLRPVAPRSVPSVFWGVRLMVLAGALELAAVAVVIGSENAVRVAVVHHFPHFSPTQWNAVAQAHITPVEIGAPIAAAVWLALAWANDRGHVWARLGSFAMLALTSISLLSAIGQHAATYAPADLIVGVALWLVALVATLLIISIDSNRHYDHRRPGVAKRDVPAKPRPRTSRCVPQTTTT